MAAAKTAKRSRRNGFPHFYLGVDGGGTKTHVAVLNDARVVVGEGAAGPSNPLRVGVETAVHNIIKAADQAMDAAGIFRSDVAAATLGLAGVRRADLKQRVKASFTQQLRIRKAEVLTDAEIALFATTLGKPGLVLIAGPTSSGKSTTLAALLDAMNRRTSQHIVSIEDPAVCATMKRIGRSG